ncbi:hypothetical protein B0J11DRAFT_135882 [Dendryphion nanum]|uniref:HMG box domain-containing protein n=1 Tax=Dendryphion nanum TaxID=256645 RepID=A0A9P9D828_9PLEO|nr:hypothetical protein B0J11DRAFT_135882 [Dendryphion nanum]
MLARGVICRLAATDVPKTSTQDLPHLAHFLHQSLLRRNAIPLSTARALTRAFKVAVAQSRRSYATTATTKRATKASTGTVKRTVKSAAAKKPAAKKKTVAKKPAAKPKSRAAAKKKATPKKRATKKTVKPKPKTKRVRKVLTEEEKLALRIKKLKVTALREPVGRNTISAYNAFLAEKSKGHAGEEMKTVWKTIGDEFKKLTPAEREHFNHLANETNIAREAEYKAWVRSHTPDQIRLANNARNLLKKLLPSKNNSSPPHTQIILDDRRTTRPLNAWVLYYRERVTSGDFKGIAVSESCKLISKEWKALTVGEKQKYEDASKADNARYHKEVERVSKTA